MEPIRPCGELSRLRKDFYEATRTYKSVVTLLDVSYDRPGFNTAYLNVEDARKALENAGARLSAHIAEDGCELPEESKT